jgi:hypothetical protein
MGPMTTLPLVAGVGLSVLAGVVRVRAWFGAIRKTAPGLRYRDVLVAHLAGAGFNGLVPAHGGDAVKLALVKRRTADTPVGVLLGTLAPPAAVEAMTTALLLVWALGTGVLGSPPPGAIPLPVVGAAATIAAGVLWLLARRAPRLLRNVRKGMTGLRHPAQLATLIAPWVLCARAVRIAAILCFLSAVGLPATLSGALLVMAVQGGVGSNGPGAPVRMAILAASLPAVIGVPVNFQTVAELIGATQVATLAVNLPISIVTLGLTLRTASPRRLVGYCREQMRPAPASTS